MSLKRYKESHKLALKKAIKSNNKDWFVTKICGMKKLNGSLILSNNTKNYLRMLPKLEAIRTG